MIRSLVLGQLDGLCITAEHQGITGISVGEAGQLCLGRHRAVSLFTQGMVVEFPSRSSFSAPCSAVLPAQPLTVRVLVEPEAR